jgi:hypothetical protein
MEAKQQRNQMTAFSLTKISSVFFRLERDDGSVFEITRESTDPNDWIVAFWGAADIEGFAPTLGEAIALANTSKVPA